LSFDARLLQRGAPPRRAPSLSVVLTFLFWNAQGQDKSVYPVLLEMIRNTRNQLEIDHSLTFMKVISENAGQNVACQDVISDMLVALLALCNSGHDRRDMCERSVASIEQSQPEMTVLSMEMTGRSLGASMALPLQSPEAMRIKAAAVIRNLASSEAFCQILCETEGVLETFAPLLASCPEAGYRQALGALCNISAFGPAAELILSFPKPDLENPKMILVNTILQNLLSFTQSKDEWTCVQSIITLQNLLEHDIDMSQWEMLMIEKFETIVLHRGDMPLQARIKAAQALASLTWRESACSLIAGLDDNTDTRIFGFLLGLGREEDALPEEVEVGLWALSNVAALETNTENKFLEVDFLLDRIGHCAANGTDEQKVAAAAVIKNLCPHSVQSSEYIGALKGVVASLHNLVLSDNVAVYEHALGALCNLTTACVKTRVMSVGHCLLSLSAPLAAKAIACAADENEILKIYAAGLICNMAASDGGKDTTAQIGRHQGIMENMVAALASPSDEVRINVLSALCNLAHTDINKIHIGQVPGCLEKLNSFLELGTDAEKAQTCMLVFYLSFTFKNNAGFGELLGLLDRVVEQLRLGNDEQIENAAAALSILSCNSNNAAILTADENRPSLLQTFASTLRHGNNRQRVNVVVCMWNLSANSIVAKADIGKLSSIFIYLVDILKEDATSELAQQTVGLLAELLHENQRNAMLFGKVDLSVETLLELSFETSLKSVVELNACWGVTNFAAGDDERLRRVAEMDGALTAMSRLIARGDKKQQQYACQMLASDVLKSQAGRKKIVRVPGLLASLATACTNFEDDRRRYSVEVLNNLAAGPSTRQALAKLDGIVKALETAVADPKSSKWSQYYASCCLASLCLDPDLTDQLGDWECTHGLLLSNLKCDDHDLVDAAAEAFHNLLASNKDNRELFSDNRELMDRIVQLAGEDEGRASGTHAVGGLFQLVRASKEFAKEIIHHPSLAAQLVKALQFGSDKTKELSCAILAILGENDDDISSLDDDVLNMRITMCDGSFDALQHLFVRGTPQQAMHATAVLSNLLISTGSFMKTQLAENEHFLQMLIKFVRNASPLHRTYAVRLLYHMMNHDFHIIELVSKLPSSIPVLLELLDTGNPDQRLYACQCAVQLATLEQIVPALGAYNKCHIFKVLLQILMDPRSPLKGPALEMMRMLTADDANKAQIIRIDGLVEYLAQVACKGSKAHSTSAAGTLLELSKFSKELRATLSSGATPLAALEHLLQMVGTARQHAALLVFHLAAETPNLDALVAIPNIFETLGLMVVQGDYLDQDAACSALWKLFEHPLYGMKQLNKASQVVKQLVLMMEEVDDSGHSVATSHRDEIVLSAMLQMGKDDYGCSVISLVPGIFRMLIKQSAREGVGDGHPWIALSIVKRLLHGNSTCCDTMLKELDALPVLLGAVRLSNASLVRDALSILHILSEKPRGFQPQIIDANKDKGDVWDTLLSFTDQHLMDASVFSTTEYNRQRQRAFGILGMLAKGNQVVCNRITQKRVCTDIIARGIVNVSGACRQSALNLAIECSCLNEHFAKKLGNEKSFIKVLTGALGAKAEVDIEYPFAAYDQKLTLSLLSSLCANELHCQTIGAASGFWLALLTMMHEGAENRARAQVQLDQMHCDDDADAAGKVGAGDKDESKPVDMLERRIGEGLLGPDVVDDVDDTLHVDIEAANLVRVLINKDKNCNALVRVPYPIAETLILAAMAQQEQQRKYALAIMWTIAMTSQFGLELLGKKATALMQALSHICMRRKQHTQEVLLLLADLLHDKKCKLALLANRTLMSLLVDCVGQIDKTQLAACAIRAVECLAQDFAEGKRSIGERHGLVKTLVQLKYTGAEVLAQAASAALHQLIKECDENTGIFHRLRVEYAR